VTIATTPSPSATANTGSSGSGSSDFWETIIAGATSIGIALIAILIAWLILRLIIVWVTNGIERGAEVSRRQMEKLERYGKTPLSDAEEKDRRLEAERRHKRAHTIRTVLTSLVTVLAITTFLFVVLSVLGVPVAALLASAGVLSVAVGFGAQSLVKDIISGAFMLMEDQYGVGDIIDVGEAIGTVEDVGLRCVRLRALDGTVWYVPNGQIVRVGNMTRTWSRVLVEQRFAYDTDLDVARQAMLDAVAEARKDPEIDAAILGEPEVPGIEAIAYNSVTVRVLIQVNPATQWTVQREIRKHLRRILTERGIELSAPETVPMVGVHVPGTTVDKKKPGPRKKSEKPTVPESPSDALPPEGDDS
jgi:small-conductance mechanosensitive channel